MRKAELVKFATEIIKKYYAAEKELILSDPDCCQSDTMQSLVEECYGFFYEFKRLLE